MEKQEYAFDWHRLFLGEHPPTYLLEIVLRVLLVYTVTLLFLRWGGKRTMGELTFFDFAIIIALGSAVGDGMIFDDVPLLHSFLVVACVIGLERLVAHITEDNKTLEKMVEGEPSLLVEDGVIVKENMHGERLSKDELFEGLRREGIHHLGEVAIAYLEPSGKLSVIKFPGDRPGLSVLPQGKRLCTDERLQDVLCCKTCGYVMAKSDDQPQCPNCGEKKWSKATSAYCANTPPEKRPPS
jgi:uncharacterized membrane protein YcaP (DUF421 family)